MAETAPPPRSQAARISDTLNLLTQEVDCWVASASADGDAYLVPLSYLWDGSRIILATAQTTRTARNLVRAGRVRLALGPPRDVVMVDGTIETVDLEALDPALADAYTVQAGWDPRDESSTHVYLVVTPERIQAWRTAAELPDRTIMERGQWL